MSLQTIDTSIIESFKEKEKRGRGLFRFPKKRSKSLDNIHQLENSPSKSSDSSQHRSPSRSPQVERHTSNFLSTSPGGFGFKGLRKKFHAIKLSKSNSDLLDRQNAVDSKRHQSVYSGNLLDGKSPRELKKLYGSKEEMRKKSRGSEASSTNGNTPNEQISHKSASIDHADLNASLNASRQRTSADLSDQFVVVDTIGYDDSYEDSSAFENDEIDGSPAEYTAQEIERLLKKIEKTREELIHMQAMKDENVKEYLKTADSTDVTNLKTKINFEKSNQKTNTSIQTLQKKLEKYQCQLKELRERGIHGPRRIIKVVQESVRSGASTVTEAVSKPLGSLNQFMKKDKKSASSDNISITVTNDEIENSYYSNLNSNNISDDENNSGSSCSNNLITSSHLENSYNGSDHVRINPNNEKMIKLEKENDELKENILVLKDDFESVVKSLQTEQYKTEQLRSQLDDMLNQWNDLTELHQNEMMGLKQEMDRTAERIECVEYRFSERSEDIEEEVDNCNTRITKMELQQHQNQQLLLSVDSYFDGGGKVLLSKFLSLVISIFAILLVIISTISKILMPFASTRMRVVTSLITLMTLVLLWRNSDHVYIQTILYYINELFRPILNWLPQRNTDELSEQPVDR